MVRIYITQACDDGKAKRMRAKTEYFFQALLRLSYHGSDAGATPNGPRQALTWIDSGWRAELGSKVVFHSQ